MESAKNDKAKEAFFNASRKDKPATAAATPVYSPPLKTEFIPTGPNITGMGRSRRRKLKGKKTSKRATKHRRR